MKWTKKLSGFIWYSDAGYRIALGIGYGRPAAVCSKVEQYYCPLSGERKKFKDRYVAFEIAHSVKEAMELCELELLTS